MQWVVLELTNTRPIIIGNVYRPPGESVDYAIQDLNLAYEEISKFRIFDLFILGDLNIDLLDKL